MEGDNSVGGMKTTLLCTGNASCKPECKTKYLSPGSSGGHPTYQRDNDPFPASLLYWPSEGSYPTVQTKIMVDGHFGKVAEVYQNILP